MECLWREEEIHREFQEVIQTISDMDRGLLGNIRNKQWIDLLDDIVKQLEAFVRMRTFFIKGIDRMETRECTPYIMSASSRSIRFLPCGISDTDDFIISGRIQSFSRKSLDDLIGFLRSEADRTQWDETNTLI